MSEEFERQSGCSPEGCASCPGCTPDDTPKTIRLTLDDDTEVECMILTIYPIGNRQYIALLPMEQDEPLQDGEVYLYGFSQTASGDPVLSNIEDDDEYQRAADGFEELLASAKLAAASDAFED